MGPGPLSISQIPASGAASGLRWPPRRSGRRGVVRADPLVGGGGREQEEGFAEGVELELWLTWLPIRSYRRGSRAG